MRRRGRRLAGGFGKAFRGRFRRDGKAGGRREEASPTDRPARRDRASEARLASAG